MLPADYVELLGELGVAFTAYERATGNWPVLVGGAATAIQTAGDFMSGDFDIVASDDTAFAAAMNEAGFVAERSVGHGLGGFYHPAYPAYGVEQVSGSLFDGRSDRARLIKLIVRDGSAIVLPSIEDLIADRLAQHAVASASDDSRLMQARELLRIAKEIDGFYLKRRIIEESGDPTLLGL